MTDETPPPPPEAQPPKRQATTVTAGTLIMGTYEIEQLINSGGMGEVYRGRNIHNGEPVAIKIVLPALAHDPKIVALFQKESTVLSRLAHEAIVRYHVFTNDPAIGRPCMVMEFVSGQALSDRIEQGPMPLEDVKTMLRRVASGLDKAHRAGVVHRDLSPDNVILEEGKVEHAKLIDFGIAKSSNFGSGTLLQGQFAGKFNWVSPEQLGAYGGQVDGRSDIYSLALITAAASKGAVLPMGASIVDAVSKRSSVPDLSGVDPALVPLLSWMLQPDPGQRVDSMARVIAALDNPALLPQPEAAAPAAPDPNRTVIEPLPVITTPPAPQTAAPTSWQAPPRTAPPEAATIIAPQPVVPVEDEMASPFGAPASPARPAPVRPAPVAPPAPAKGGKGGLLAAVAVVALLGAGAGAWYAGLLGPSAPEKQADAAPVQPEVKPAEPSGADQAAAEKAAAEQAAADAAAAEKAAADKAAADQAAAEAKAAADKAAAEQAAQEQAAADKAAAEKAAADQAAQEKAAAEAKAAEEQAAADKAAAEKAAQEKAAAEQAAQEKAAQEKAATEAKAAADKAAADKAAADAAAADQAAAKAAADKAAADQAAQEKAAAEKAAAEAQAADPVASQQAYFDTLPLSACTYAALEEPAKTGFRLGGFAVDSVPFEKLAADWQAATKVKPDITVNRITEAQCSVLDFMAANRTSASVKIAIAGDTAIKSGSVVEGTITGIDGRPFSVFLVNGSGGATNIAKWVTTDSAGKTTFRFAPRLKEGAASSPQLLLVVIGDAALAQALAGVKPNVIVGQLVGFVDGRLKDTGPDKALGLGWFRLEN